MYRQVCVAPCLRAYTRLSTLFIPTHGSTRRATLRVRADLRARCVCLSHRARPRTETRLPARATNERTDGRENAHALCMNACEYTRGMVWDSGWDLYPAELRGDEGETEGSCGDARDSTDDGMRMMENDEIRDFSISRGRSMLASTAGR